MLQCCRSMQIRFVRFCTVSTFRTFWSRYRPPKSELYPVVLVGDSAFILTDFNWCNFLKGNAGRFLFVLVTFCFCPSGSQVESCVQRMCCCAPEGCSQSFHTAPCTFISHTARLHKGHCTMHAYTQDTAHTDCTKIAYWCVYLFGCVEMCSALVHQQAFTLHCLIHGCAGVGGGGEVGRGYSVCVCACKKVLTASNLHVANADGHIAQFQGQSSQ